MFFPTLTPRFRDGKGTGGEEGTGTVRREGRREPPSPRCEPALTCFPDPAVFHPIFQQGREGKRASHVFFPTRFPFTVSPQVFSRDGRRESEGKREREPALSIPSFFVVPFTKLLSVFNFLFTCGSTELVNRKYRILSGRGCGGVWSRKFGRDRRGPPQLVGDKART